MSGSQSVAVELVPSSTKSDGSSNPSHPIGLTGVAQQSVIWSRKSTSCQSLSTMLDHACSEQPNQCHPASTTLMPSLESQASVTQLGKQWIASELRPETQNQGERRRGVGDTVIRAPGKGRMVWSAGDRSGKCQIPS